MSSDSGRPALHLPARYLAIVQDILRRYLPHAEVWAYGSRVNGDHYDASDLDLVVRQPDDLTRRQPDLDEVAAAFSDSDLPILVQIVDWACIPEAFREEIEANYVVLQPAHGAPAAATDPQSLAPTLERNGSQEMSRVVALSAQAVPEGWSILPLGDLTSWISGGTPSKSNSEFWGGDIPWISAKSLKSFYLFDSEDHVTEAAIVDGARQADTGDILILVRGMTLHNDVPVGVAMCPMTFNQDVKGLRGKGDAATRYIAYWLVGNKWRLLAAVDEASHGTGRLRTEVLQEMDVLLPPPDEQESIAAVLGMLDDKIEQNRRTARALERLARAVFRAWFVNFEPVKAKAAGATSFPSMPQPVFDALHIRFVNSEIGPVPEGWEVKTFGDLLVLQYGKALKADDRQPGTIPVYGSNGQVGWHNEAIAAGPGIVVGRKGNPGKVNWSQEPFFAIDTTFFVQLADAGSSLPLLFHQLEAADLGRLAADSAVPGVNRNMIYAEPCVVPHTTILDAFDKLVLELWELQTALAHESGKLAELRDYLLPKLLSGELRVKDAATTAEGLL